MTTAATETYEQRTAREERERKQHQDQAASLARWVAKELGADVVPDRETRSPWDCSYRLRLDGREFSLDFGHPSERHKPMRCTVSAIWPREQILGGSSTYHTPRDYGFIPRDGKEPWITSAAAKGGCAIAKDIQRRFLPEFVALYDKMRERNAMHEKAGRDAMAAAEELGREWGVIPKANGAQDATLYIMGHALRVSAWSSRLSIRFERSLDGLSMDQARRVLAIIKENQ